MDSACGEVAYGSLSAHRCLRTAWLVTSGASAMGSMDSIHVCELATSSFLFFRLFVDCYRPIAPVLDPLRYRPYQSSGELCKQTGLTHGFLLFIRRA